MNTTTRIAQRCGLLVDPFPEHFFTPSEKRNVITFVTEVTLLSDRDTGCDLHLERLHASSRAHGFSIKFGEEGPAIGYYLVRINYSVDCPGDLESWEYQPLPESVEQYPAYKNTRAYVVND